MTRYLIVLSIIYLSFSTNLYSQSCNLSVSGKITDLHDESPIIGALVFIEGTNNFSQTDENGEYLIEALKILSKDSLSNLTPHPKYVWWHYSHPTLFQRVIRL